MISARQLHFDQEVFGDDAGQFDQLRFLKNPNLQRSPSFRPFGGGATLCPGRDLAKSMVLTFVVLLLQNYDVGLAVPQLFPRYDDNKPSIGITAGTDDLLVKLTPRSY